MIAKTRPLNVLVGCESSGAVRGYFRALGHNAWSCDYLPADDGDPHHLQCDVFEAIASRRWDLGIFFPTCTFLCSSGLHWNKRVPGRAEKTEEALDFVQRLMDADIDRIGLENPMGCISTRIRKPDQIIQPFEFGDDASKATCLWLKKLDPLKKEIDRFVKPRLVCKGAASPHMTRHSESAANIASLRQADCSQDGAIKRTADRTGSALATIAGKSVRAPTMASRARWPRIGATTK